MGTRDPEATKRRILDAALREFSDKGIAGARVDAIAERACVNKRMLYYYFGSKEGLFREILKRRVVQNNASGHDHDVSAAGRLARRQRRLAQEEDYVRLLAWEALESRSGPVIDDAQRRGYFKEWVTAIEAEQRAGRIPAELDAAQLVLTEVCLVIGPLMLPQLTRLITGCSAHGATQLERRTEFLDTLEARIYS